MRRTLLAVVIAFSAALPASAAPGSVTVNDAAGDWAVPSQDILKTEVWSGLAGKTRTVRVTFTLAAAPDPSTTYATVLSTPKCGTSWALRVHGVGTSAVAATVERAECTTTGALTPATEPATVTVAGSKITVTAPYALGMAKGTRIAHVGTMVSTYWTGVAFVGGGVDEWVMSGDYSLRDVTYALR